jgi:hypothetical protein
MELACPCSAVKIRISADPIAQFWCHCRDCQTVHGAAYVAEVVYLADAVEVLHGETTAFALKTTPRLSCAVCATRLVIELDDLGMRSINGYLLGDRFQPTLHINCAEAIAPVHDGLPHYATKPAAFGGDDKLVAW